MEPIIKPLMKALNGSPNVAFEHMLDAFIIIHKLKPYENCYLKLKVFAYLLDYTGKGSLNKAELEKAIYYACLNDVSALTIL